MAQATEKKRIFSLADYNTLKRLQREITDHRELLEKSLSCGINCEAECQQCEGAKVFLDALESTFFDPPPAEILQQQE